MQMNEQEENQPSQRYRSIEHPIVARYVNSLCLIAILVLGTSDLALAQTNAAVDQETDEVTAQASEVPEISDEPKQIDPRSVLPEELTQAVTMEFKDVSIREFVSWIEEEVGLTVLLDELELSEVGVLLEDPIEERSDGEPLYLLLNRLQSVSIGWYYDSEILYITSTSGAVRRNITKTYRIGDLLDAGFEADDIEETIQNTVAVEEWADVGGAGNVMTLGDVMFVTQYDKVHTLVACFLEALRETGRQTFIAEPTEHIALREALDQRISITTRDSPLGRTLQQISQQAGVVIRPDIHGLQDIGVSVRQPITLRINDLPLRTVLRAIEADLGITYVYQNGVIWLTTRREAEYQQKTAIYDVRDLCRDEAESDALAQALMNQESDIWSDVGGTSQLEFVSPGLMVITTSDQYHETTLQLLEAYRLALTSSKQRDSSEEEANEVLTLYYKLNATLADALIVEIPQTIAPETWTETSEEEAVGEIKMLPSTPDLQLLPENAAVSTEVARFLTQSSVLVITQTRENHLEIAKFIDRVQHGDPNVLLGPYAVDAARRAKQAGSGGGFGGGGGGFGGGGFGGGLFSIGGK